jgi:aspartyl-tRNA(Asn)/glutamyl-tRNA(Gln) amidotransferase subunit A
LRILYVPRFGQWPVDQVVAESCAAAARNLAALGHSVEEGTLPVDLDLFEKNWPTFTAGGLAWLLRGKEWRGRIGAIYEEMAEKGAALTAADYIEGLNAFREVQAQFARAFRDWDVIVTPSAGTLPWDAQKFGQPHHRAFTGIVNAGGLPGMNIPCDPSPDGLPIGIQAIGAYGADWLLVALARQYEAAHPWAQRWPSL